MAKAPHKTRPGLRLPELAEAARECVYRWRRRAATVGTGTLAVFMAYGVIFGHNGITAYMQKREEPKVREQQMQQLQTENERLREHIDHLQNDPDAIEHAARAELHYTRSGEVIYTLPRASDAAAGSAASSDSGAGSSSAPQP